MSRLIARLDQAIATCGEPAGVECLRAERAVALVRLGRQSEARQALKGVRMQSHRLRDPRVQAWVCLAGGVIDHFDSVSPEQAVIASFEAARSCAQQAGDAGLQAHASAWLAAVRLNSFEASAMADALLDVQRLVSPQDRATLARAHLVRANAARVAGLADDEIRRQEHLVHQHATADGDLAMVAALIHNRASCQTDRLDREAAFGELHADLARQVLLEIESGANLDQSLRSTAQSGLRVLMKARLYAVLQDWPQALACLNQHLQAKGKAARYQRGTLLALRAWCQTKLGCEPLARADAQQALAALDPKDSADDRATLHARLASTWEALGDLAAADEQRNQAYLALAEFKQFQVALARELARLERPAA